MNCSTPQRVNVLFTITIHYSDSSPSYAFTISTRQIRALCPVLPQRPQCLCARALIPGFSSSSCPPASLGAIISVISPTVNVFWLWKYRILRLLRFVAVSAARRRLAISLRSNTISCITFAEPFLSRLMDSTMKQVVNPRPVESDRE